ncbi:peptide/nickel transport system permease protein [Stella humosa]|uniref:Peptide/nickel transport system permease protein n=1 Tax=Stella humosa TaxID=94 RepID=A0A3N1MBA5_9PROT|nr:ABC transporter permease [Stella humosa]ROQ00991.1 peptide/nickel transport system permease protein [Stella humosa]BBK31358.1 ABC transporter permease [Stella humosa]
MFVFILRRVAYAVPVLIGVTIVVFALVQMVPGDAADILIPPEAPREVAALLRARLGLDQPVHVRYLLWLKALMAGDLGLSMFTGRPVAGELMEALGNTLKLAIPAAILGFSSGCLLGAAAAAARGTWLDRLFSAIAITGVSLPHYWTGIVLVAIFAVILNWLPAQGMGPGGFPSSIEQIRHLVLPVITLSLIPMGVVSRLVRATVLEILGQEYVAGLHAKGLGDRRVAWHVVKNAAPPALALIGLQFGYLLGGSILVETVYNWPGSGGLMNLAIFRRDVPVLSATILVLATIFVFINILVDILQAVIDPRIRR